MYVHRCCSFRKQKCDEERRREDSKIQRRYDSNIVLVKCKNKRYISNNRGRWNHLRLIQEIPEQHIGKARNYGTAKKSHIGHSTHNTENANVKVQNVFHG